MLCWTRFQFIHSIVYYILVNVPFLTVRLIIWHFHDKHVSVFLVKNVLAMGLAVQHLHEVFIEMSDVVGEQVNIEMQQMADIHSARA